MDFILRAEKLQESGERAYADSANGPLTAAALLLEWSNSGLTAVVFSLYKEGTEEAWSSL